MDFDDHDEQEEEMGVAVGSSYESPPGNSSRGGPSGGHPAGKIGGGGDAAAAAAAVSAAMVMTGTGGSWKASGGGRYRECLKNHAVSIGGHAVDGCGEFMAAGEEGTLDALKCAACHCHRNFHRKETEGVGGDRGGVGGMMGMEGPGGFHPHFSPYYRIPAGYLQHHHTAAHIRPSPLPLALPSTSGGGGAQLSSGRDDQEEDMSINPMVAGGGAAARELGKKRHRTKFSQEQKDQMLAFAEKLGWRIQKHDEAAVQHFCAETNVRRHVLKVWMHNNKHTLGGAAGASRSSAVDDVYHPKPPPLSQADDGYQEQRRQQKKNRKHGPSSSPRLRRQLLPGLPGRRRAPPQAPAPQNGYHQEAPAGDESGTVGDAADVHYVR